MRTCRDCDAPANASDRFCASCRIWNPVNIWVYLPDGGHLNGRATISEGMGGGPALAFAGAGRAIAVPRASATRHEGPDNLAMWAIFLTIYEVLALTTGVGGLLGSIIALVIGLPFQKQLPIRADGRQIPANISWAVIALNIALRLAEFWFLYQLRTQGA